MFGLNEGHEQVLKQAIIPQQISRTRRGSTRCVSSDCSIYRSMKSGFRRIGLVIYRTCPTNARGLCQQQPPLTNSLLLRLSLQIHCRPGRISPFSSLYGQQRRDRKIEKTSTGGERTRRLRNQRRGSTTTLNGYTVRNFRIWDCSLLGHDDNRPRRTGCSWGWRL